MTISAFNKLITYLSADSCPIINLFVDWNPIYMDTFLAGDSNAGNAANVLYQAGEGETNHWAKL